MGYLFLFLSKLSAILKMIAMKKCGNIASGSENSLRINLVRSLGCLVISIVVSCAIGFREMSAVGVWIAVGYGVANALLLFSWVLAAERASLCTVEIFCMAGGVIVPMLVTPLFLSGETVGVLAWVGAALLLPAALLLFPRSSGGSTSISALPMLLLAGAANAGCVLSQKLYAAYGGGTAADFNTVSFATTIPVLVIIYILLRMFKKGANNAENDTKVPKTLIIVYIIIAIIGLYGAQYLHTLASGLLRSEVLFPLSYAMSMPLTLLTDMVFFRERIRVRGVVGILLAVASAVLCNLQI
jgi:drug/metabolite transporter (DMT)-like permease